MMFVSVLLYAVPISGQVALTTAQIAKRVSPSVVVIRGQTASGDVLGSGFIVSKDGKIVTNLHVVRDMETATVQMASGDIFDSVSVLATDERRDLAVLQIAGFNLPMLELGDSDAVTVGETLVAVGSPRGLDGTVTAGILSSVRDSGGGFKVLQTDASVNPGNSGGPLVNSRGQAIGVVSSKLRSAENLNFAIPINYARGLMNALQSPMTLKQMSHNLQSTEAPAPGVNRPPLKETLDWLKEKLPLGIVHYVIYNDCDPKTCVNGIPTSLIDQTTVWRLDSCSAIFGDVLTLTAPDGRGGVISGLITTRYAAPLGVLSGGFVQRRENTIPRHTFVSGERWGYYLSLTSKSEEISVTRSSSAGTSAQTTTLIELRFNNEALATRVLQAFNHAAELCRVREPF